MKPDEGCGGKVGESGRKIVTKQQAPPPPPSLRRGVGQRARLLRIHTRDVAASHLFFASVGWRTRQRRASSRCKVPAKMFSLSLFIHLRGIFLTGSNDKNAKLWLLNADCSAATCVFTLRGHSDLVRSVAFHPSATYLPTGSSDGTAKSWLLNADCSAATCVFTRTQ